MNMKTSIEKFFLFFVFWLFSPFVLGDEQQIINNNFFITGKIGKTGNSKTEAVESGYSNLISFGIGSYLNDDTSYKFEYSDDFSYLSTTFLYHFSVNERVNIQVGSGLGLSIEDQFYNNGFRSSLFPVVDLGFNYRIDDSFSVGSGYRHLFSLNGTSNSINELFLSFEYKFNDKTAQSLPVKKHKPVYEPEVVLSPEPVHISVYFELEKYKLSDSDKNRLISEIKEKVINSNHNLSRINIKINTDGTGSKNLNAELSKNRTDYFRDIIVDLFDDNVLINTEEWINYNSPLLISCLSNNDTELKSCLKEDRKTTITFYF